MPKNQNLGALEQAILEIEADTKKRGPRQAAELKAARMKVIKDLADIKSGKVNPMLEIYKNMSGDGYKDGGKVKSYRNGGKTGHTCSSACSCKSKSKTRGMGAALRGGNFSGVR